MVADKPSEDWDAYWRRMHEASAYGAGGLKQETLERFWRDLFRQTCPSATHPRVLDLACGHGAVARFAIEAARGGPAPSVYALDISPAAIAELQRNIPGVLGVAANAAQAPFASGSFDVVASQFGLEYAGPRAFEEAARLVAPKGIFAAVLHMKDGAIYRECARNVQVAGAILGGGVFPLARTAFAAGFAVRDRQGPMSEFQRASEALVPAVRALADLMRQYGENVAGGTAKALQRDIAHMYRRLNAYDECEVLDWVAGMEREVATYIGRMSSMTQVAIDEAGFARIVGSVAGAGWRVQTQAPMPMDRSPEPAAFVLVTQRD